MGYQKMRKGMHSQDGATAGTAPFEFGSAQNNRRAGSK